ncbi:hypothetical protein KH141_06645 [butyrate-producing bacterium]|jgi:hypothetical protein|nr:hypothetical protein [butyrate-producing bacterium]
MLNSNYKKHQKNTGGRVQILLRGKMILSENLHMVFRLREDSICIIIGYNSVKTGRKRVDRPRPVSMRNDRRFREKKFGRQQK